MYRARGSVEDILDRIILKQQVRRKREEELEGANIFIFAMIPKVVKLFKSSTTCLGCNKVAPAKESRITLVGYSVSLSDCLLLQGQQNDHSCIICIKRQQQRNLM